MDEKKPKKPVSAKSLANLTHAGKGRPKGIKNRQTLFKEMWKEGLERVIAKHGGPEKFIEDWLTSRHGKQELNNHMLRVSHPVKEEIDVNHSGGIEVLIVDHLGDPKDPKASG